MRFNFPAHLKSLYFINYRQPYFSYAVPLNFLKSHCLIGGLQLLELLAHCGTKCASFKVILEAGNLAEKAVLREL